jgi:hypothetical protein
MKQIGSFIPSWKIFKAIQSTTNHYYTDTINKRRQDRQKAVLAACVEEASFSTPVIGCGHNAQRMDIDLDKVVAAYSTRSEADMEIFSCEEALDCLFAIYKVGDVLYPHCPLYSKFFGPSVETSYDGTRFKLSHRCRVLGVVALHETIISLPVHSHCYSEVLLKPGSTKDIRSQHHYASR